MSFPFRLCPYPPDRPHHTVIRSTRNGAAAARLDEYHQLNAVAVHIKGAQSLFKRREPALGDDDR
jgi:hypothetical protein